MNTELHPGITELLEMAGARPHGKRFDCPDCGARGTVSVDASKQVFCCHHAGCEFHGGIGTLQRRLGIERERIPRAEYLQRRKTQQRTREASQRLSYASKARQLELQARLQELGRAELLAHEQGAHDPAAWDTLTGVYAERPRIERELDGLESGSAAQVFQAITDNSEEHPPQKPPHCQGEKEVNVCQ